MTCPANWTPFNANGGCYKYFAKEYSWEEARDECLSEKVSHIDTFKPNPESFHFRTVQNYIFLQHLNFQFLTSNASLILYCRNIPCFNQQMKDSFRRPWLQSILPQKMISWCNWALSVTHGWEVWGPARAVQTLSGWMGLPWTTPVGTLAILPIR